MYLFDRQFPENQPWMLGTTIQGSRHFQKFGKQAQCRSALNGHPHLLLIYQCIATPILFYHT